MVLLVDTGTVLSTRIGTGVVFEEFAGSALIKSLIPNLGVTADNSAIPFLEAGKNDKDREIKEIIAGSLESLTETSNA